MMHSLHTKAMVVAITCLIAIATTLLLQGGTLLVSLNPNSSYTSGGEWARQHTVKGSVVSIDRKTSILIIAPNHESKEEGEGEISFDFSQILDNGKTFLPAMHVGDLIEISYLPTVGSTPMVAHSYRMIGE